MITTGTRVLVYPKAREAYSCIEQQILWGLAGQVVSDNKFRHPYGDADRHYEVLFDYKVIAKGLMFTLDELKEIKE